MGVTINAPVDPTMSYSVETVASMWSCHKNTIYKLIGQKKLFAFSVGQNYRITGDSMLSYQSRFSVTSEGKREARNVRLKRNTGRTG